MRKFDLQRRIAARQLNCGVTRVRFTPDHLGEIKEAITNFDVLLLIKKGAIVREPARGISRVRARARHIQKRKGRRRGHGTRKGVKTAREPSKRHWVFHARAQRALLKRMRDAGLLSTRDYRTLYQKIRGGFFRSVRHIKLYAQEQRMLKAKKETKTKAKA